VRADRNHWLLPEVGREAVRATAQNPLALARSLRPVETDGALLERLRAGDEAAFVTLVGRYQASLLRVARAYVPSKAVAEEAVQETWMGVVRGIGGFEGRSSFKTWLFRILVNRARSLGSSEGRTIPLDDPEPAVDPSRFDPTGAWSVPPEPWESVIDDRLLAQSWLPCIRAALDRLPARQREVVVLRDVEGLTSDDVCEVLGISEGNQRVLLHRGRSRLRSQLEGELVQRGR
jgi:RNA polymerase sigma-70 factor, ECF subfamily